MTEEQIKNATDYIEFIKWVIITKSLTKDKDLMKTLKEHQEEWQNEWILFKKIVNEGNFAGLKPHTNKDNRSEV